MIVAARFGEKRPDGTLICRLCPAECVLTEGKVGICRSRYNRDGELVTDNYGELVTLAVDPIEKKPLYHFYPGSSILSTGPNCCNLGCLHCQNWTISQQRTSTVFFTPERLAQAAEDHGSLGIAFTYTEPLVWYEYIIDTAPLVRRRGLKVVLVTNGYINPEPLAQLLPLVDAMNIDLKGIRREFYLRICRGKIEPVLNNIRTVAASGVHLELTNLIIPGENDSPDEVAQMVDFVASVSPSIPLHLSAYHPDYRLERPSTSAETLLKARERALKKLKFVYVGNVTAQKGSDTLCPSCGQLLIQRTGFDCRVVGLRGSACSRCGLESGIIGL